MPSAELATWRPFERQLIFVIERSEGWEAEKRKNVSQFKVDPGRPQQFWEVCFAGLKRSLNRRRLPSAIVAASGRREGRRRGPRRRQSSTQIETEQINWLGFKSASCWPVSVSIWRRRRWRLPAARKVATVSPEPPVEQAQQVSGAGLAVAARGRGISSRD